MEVVKDSFSISFKVLESFGLLTPRNSRIHKKFFGFSMFCYIYLQFSAASIYRLLYMKSSDELMVAILYVLLSTSFLVYFVNFKLNQSIILELVESFGSLRRELLEREITKIDSKILKQTKRRFIKELSAGMILAILILIFSQKKRFVIAVLFETDNDFWYYALYLIHYLQVFCIALCSTAVESLLTISLMLMAEALEQLKKKIDLVGENSLESFVELQNKLHR
jgi:hypothetical protein